MARISIPASRASRNIRNGPSALQTRLSSLLHEARRILFFALAVALATILFSWHPNDPGWSHAVHTAQIHNWFGVVGAYIADMLIFLFGYSAWCWVVLLLQRTAPNAFLHLLHLPVADHALHRLRWEVGLGFACLLPGAMGLETLLKVERTGIATVDGGQLGQLLVQYLSLPLGQVGCTLLLLTFFMIGTSLFFQFSWLTVCERLGQLLETLVLRTVAFFHYTKALWQAYQDRKVGKAKRAQRIEAVEIKQELLSHTQAVHIEPVFTVPQSARAEKEKQKEQQQTLFADTPETHPLGELPALSLLDMPSEQTETVSADTIEFTSRLIEKKLSDFGVNVTVVTAQAGPVITRYEIEPAVGVKGSQIVNLAKDLARALSLISIRVVETIPGKNLMGLELPNPRRQTVRLSEIIGSKPYHASKSALTMVLGKDIAGHPVVADLEKMPHLLVAGTTGSGKSVGINAMILSLLYKADAHKTRLILIDPKMLELSIYEGIPHLLAPVVTDMRQAANALNWCVAEMDKRYKLMSKLGVRHLAGFNSKIREAQKRGEPIANPFSLTPDAPEPLSTLPMIVVIIDELADLMMVVGKKIEEPIARLAQKARASGIHLVLATQRPSVDVITGLIKANFPTRIAFQVSSRIDSRTILDQMGAETLLGQGDMLYMPSGTSLPMRVHGAFVSDEEVHRVVEHLKQQGEPDYVEGLLEGTVQGETGDGVGSVTGLADAQSDPLYDQAVAVVLKQRKASISLVQRHLRIGYNRAARLIEQMEHAGMVSAMQSNGNRDILVPTGARDEDA